MAANGQHDLSHYQLSSKCSKPYLYFTVRDTPSFTHGRFESHSPLFSTELDINMGLIKLILANQPTNMEID